MDVVFLGVNGLLPFVPFNHLKVIAEIKKGYRVTSGAVSCAVVEQQLKMHQKMGLFWVAF
jgi:hypothetical protein